MKKLLSAIALGASLAFTMPNCSATDVWVSHWSSENVDIYVMDDTITSGTSGNGRYFKVSTKKVKDGQLQQVINWTFEKYKSDMWRYETSTMKGNHTTVVIPRNGVFEFCMNQLGWTYRIEGSWYY